MVLLLSEVLSVSLLIWVVITVLFSSYSSAVVPRIYFSSFLRATIGIAFIVLLTLIIMMITGWDPTVL